MTLRSATQCPGLLRDALAELLDIPEHCVRVVAADVGGGFGAKSSLYPEELTISAVAKQLGTTDQVDQRPTRRLDDLDPSLGRDR